MTQGKNIVLCSDGTGNSANKGRGTNVWKIFEAVDLIGHTRNHSLKEQVAFYGDGVGTARFKLFKVISGAIGIGLSRNVKELYTELCRVYAPGDVIYLFGFSRGAFTVRTLAGLIEHCGIIETHRRAWSGSHNGAGSQDQEPIDDIRLQELVDEAYSHFREQFWKRCGKRRRASLPTNSSAEAACAEFRKKHAVWHPKHAPERIPKIRFIGVWDTVDAVGLPFDELATAINKVWPYKFPDRKLGAHVEKACHALAIDDERRSFHPTLWEETADDKPEENDTSEPRIEQVWFPGVHSNVGGGYPKQGISLVALCWMMRKAKEAGLRFLDNSFQHYWEHMNVDDKLYDPRAGLAIYYRYKPRDIAALCRESGDVEPKVHVSALYRTARGTDGYAPGNLPGDFSVVPFDPEAGVPGEQEEVLQDVVQRISGDVPKDQPLAVESSTEAEIATVSNRPLEVLTAGYASAGTCTRCHQASRKEGFGPPLPLP